MSNVRYGARSEEERRNRELEATSVGVWAKVLVATYETDPDAVAAVLPQPLQTTADPAPHLDERGAHAVHGADDLVAVA